MQHQAEIAIVDANTLSCMGLQTLLEEIIPMATIRVFHSFGELVDDTPDMYAHYFVSAQIYFEHTTFFRERHPRAIVLAGGDNLPQLAGVPTLNIYENEKVLAKSIMQMHERGHHKGGKHPHPTPIEHELTAREIEVLILITKGLINKEIAERMNISLTTVISHRKKALCSRSSSVVSDMRICWIGAMKS